MSSKTIMVEKHLVWDGPHCEHSCQFLDEDVDTNEDFCTRYVDAAGYRRLLKRDKRDTDWRCFRCKQCLEENSGEK